GRHQIFVRDRLLGVTEQVTLGYDGMSGNSDSSDPSISRDGRFVAFQSCATNLVVGDTTATCADVFVHDRQTGTTSRVTIGYDGSEADDVASDFIYTGMSADGRFVAFDSPSTNLVANDTNGVRDVFITANPNANRPSDCQTAMANPVHTLWPANHSLMRLSI